MARKRFLGTWAAVFGLVLAGAPVAAETPGPAGSRDRPYPRFYTDASPFLKAIRSAAHRKPLPQPVGGATVPHHLLAADLIAETLQLASGEKRDRILLLCPDHFQRTESAGATTDRDFDTVLGRVPTDRDAVTRLLAHPEIALSNLASHEHGLQAVLPFLAHYFPKVPVVTLVLDTDSPADQWARLADALDPLFTERTLLIQSTDFSHYLNRREACEKDAETLRVLARGDPDGLGALHQANHLDSKAAQWIQMTLQARRGATLVVVNQRNSAAYAEGFEPSETTSYLTQIYSREFVPGASLPGKAWYLAGDFHLGRRFVEMLEKGATLDFPERKLLGYTGGNPLILNLEGVLCDSPPERSALHPRQIAMPAAPTLDLLKRWNTHAAILANNHADDLDAEAKETMKRLLGEHGIVPVEDKDWLSTEDFDLFAATDLVNRPVPTSNRLRAEAFSAPPPSPFPWRQRIAFFHWGDEYRRGPNARQRWLANLAEERGFRWIVGCHSHLPSTGWEPGFGSMVCLSLGNLLFDQPEPERQGLLLELRFFEQDAVAARLLPIGHLYREWAGHEHARKKAVGTQER